MMIERAQENCGWCGRLEMKRDWDASIYTTIDPVREVALVRQADNLSDPNYHIRGGLMVRWWRYVQF